MRPLESMRMSGPAARAWSRARPVMMAAALRTSTSGFLNHFGLVPAAERELGQPYHQQEEQHAGHGDENEGGEQPRDVDGEAGLQDLVGEAGRGAAGAGDE